MNENITVKIVEKPGKVGSLKASSLAHLITDCIKANPEIIQNQKEEEH